ncbi:MAG: hypothetical protein IPM79_31110 [Polyangiaceae bacterium]|jgi:hypothetical protein|nr:hypothetical protein [Polyangiaceae bacterium]MBK8941934.1 hypothetical protein [Polyangiaceae bacterium]
MLFPMLGITLAALGCRKEGPKSAEDAQVDESGGSGGSGSRSGPSTTGVPSGPPVVNFPGFEVLPDGRSVVTVQVRGPVTVSEQKAEGRIIYVLSGVAVPEKVNRLPLVTQHFPTQVTAVTVEQTLSGANLLIDLREASPSTFKITQNEAGNLVVITLPHSQRWGTNNPSDDPTSFERPTDADSSDVVDESKDENIRKAYEAERKRRRKQSYRQPKAYVERPLTLPRMTLAPDISISAGGLGARDQAVFLNSAIRFGVIDQVEIEANPHSFRLSPNPAYAFPSIGITAGYTGNTFEIAGRARYFIGVDSDSDASAGALLIGVPMAIHLGTWGRIDTGAFVTLDFERTFRTPMSESGLFLGSGGVKAGLWNADASPLYLNTGIPFHFLFQPIQELWFGIHHGINIIDFAEPGETFALPLGGEIGFSASNDYNPTADLGLRIDLPMFLMPGRDSDLVEEDRYELGVWFRWYHHL